jgi:hypothetical protein
MLKRTLVVLAVAAGCADDTGPSPISDLAVQMQTADLTAGCNQLGFGNAPMVTPVQREAGAPAFTGGVLTDGTYTLTAVDVYGSLMPPVGREVDVISGTTLQSVSQGRTPDQQINETSTISVSGSMLTLRKTCPSAATSQWSYSVTSTGYLRAGAVGNATIVSTFTKQ